jgi:glycosyltransferase involved in cell wall biosynthesis
MHVLFLSTTDLHGGAARGSYKLFEALDDCDNINMEMLVQNKYGEHPRVTQLPVTQLLAPLGEWRKKLDLRAIWHNYPERVRTPFSVHRVPGGVAWAVRRRKPDIVNLHWVSAGFVRIEALPRFHAPVVWTLHDMWAMTGGCHFSHGCQKYMESCGNCHILRSGTENDASRRIFERKLHSWNRLNINIVAMSTWIAECARKSSLFRKANITVIPNGINTNQFFPVPSTEARQILGLPTSCRILLFGADHAINDPRKGFAYLTKSLENLRQVFRQEELLLLIFGAEKSATPNLPFPTRFMGRVGDETLRLAYGAADVFCAPSLEENMANTVLEALSCGTPVVAFNIGGMPDMIVHGKNGWLAKPFNTEDLASGITYCVNADKSIRDTSRRTALEKFDINIIARKYIEIYNSIIISNSTQK